MRPHYKAVEDEVAVWISDGRWSPNVRDCRFCAKLSHIVYHLNQIVSIALKISFCAGFLLVEHYLPTLEAEVRFPAG